MSRFGYNVKQAFSQMGRNKGMYFTTILAITAMMLILGLFFVSFVNVNNFAKSLGQDYNVIQIYMAENNSQEVTEAVGTTLQSINGVEKVEYVSKDQALATLKERWGDNGYLLENLPENPLPDSYTVYVTDKDTANSVAASAPEIKGVDDVVYYRDTIEKLAQLSHFIEMGSIVAMAFLVIVSVIIADRVRDSYRSALEVFIAAIDLCLRGPEFIRVKEGCKARNIQIFFLLSLLFESVAALFISNYPSVIDRNYSLVHFVYYIFSVSDHQDGSSSYVYLLEEPHYVHGCDRVEVSCRLVADEHPRFVYKGPCDAYSLLLAR